MWGVGGLPAASSQRQHVRIMPPYAANLNQAPGVPGRFCESLSQAEQCSGIRCFFSGSFGMAFSGAQVHISPNPSAC